MSNDALPTHVRDLIAGCPAAGNGVNNWLFRCARVLHDYRTSAAIEKLLEAAAADCGRAVTRREIERAVKNSGAAVLATHRSGTNVRRPPWPGPNLARIEEIIVDGPRLIDLWEESRVRFHDNISHAEEVIDSLFPGNSLLCIGANNHDFDTRPREEWRGHLADMALIVPAPMSAPTGVTQEGRRSAHTLRNTGARRFLVVECDFSIFARDGKKETPFAPLVRKMADVGCDTLDMGAAILFHLAKSAPMAMAVHSGGKSVHGWFCCEGEPESRLRNFMRAAVSIGADRATWTRSQFVRLPDGQREDGKRQTVYYFNPSVIP